MLRKITVIVTFVALAGGIAALAAGPPAEPWLTSIKKCKFPVFFTPPEPPQCGPCERSVSIFCGRGFGRNLCRRIPGCKVDNLGQGQGPPTEKSVSGPAYSLPPAPPQSIRDRR